VTRNMRMKIIIKKKKHKKEKEDKLGNTSKIGI
jgi:hypothetical protein